MSPYTHDESHFHYIKDDNEGTTSKKRGPTPKSLLLYCVAASKVIGKNCPPGKQGLLKSSKYLQNRLLMYYKLQPFA